MNMRLYQLFDKTAQTVVGPTVRHHRDEAAIRQFKDIIAASDTLPNKYPNDFALLYIGVQDIDTGAIVHTTEPLIIATGDNI